ncbi:hypothetical protein PCASD_03607 [Puccinia coronata f. sp. avenae]|uniref:Uncharacterized protein n=1 Tax=Puccinia coronata f. sp. avenae TaxID=200324 RepID=A0A2N5VDX2_9BASI|nr:hypothetical protein PCASD_03607 [Puccinia coronata f. sp. avenae]
MSESANISIITPSESTESTKVVPESIRQQRGLIYENFRSLAEKFEQYTIWNRSNPFLSVDVTCNLEALNELRIKVLPLLRQQLNTLPKLLDPSEVLEDMNASQLQRIIEIQSELDRTTDQVSSLAPGLRRETDSLATRADDQDSKESKYWRRQGLSNKLRLMKHQLFLIFNLCSQTTKGFQLASSSSTTRETENPTVVAAPLHPQDYNFNDDPDPCGIVGRTGHVVDSIGHAMRWMISHEFILVQEHWHTSVYSCDQQLIELTQLINRALRPPKPEDVGKSSRGPGTRNLKKHATPLAQSFIPLTKLSRIFLKKLAKEALNKIPSKPYTNMSSCQLTTLSHSGRSMDSGYYDMMRFIAEYDMNNAIHERNPPESIEDILCDVVRSLDSSVLLVITHVIPLIPDSISSPNLLQNYLTQWTNLFLLATQNCIRAADSYNAAQSAETDE